MGLRSTDNAMGQWPTKTVSVAGAIKLRTERIDERGERVRNAVAIVEGHDSRRDQLVQLGSGACGPCLRGRVTTAVVDEDGPATDAVKVGVRSKRSLPSTPRRQAGSEGYRETFGPWAHHAGSFSAAPPPRPSLLRSNAAEFWSMLGAARTAPPARRFVLDRRYRSSRLSSERSPEALAVHATSTVEARGPGRASLLS